MVFYFGNHLLLSVFQPYFHSLKFLKALLLLSSMSNKDVLFIFSANKVTAEKVPLLVPMEQKVVKDIHRLNLGSLRSDLLNPKFGSQKSALL